MFLPRVVDQLADLTKFVRGRAVVAQCAQQQCFCRATKRAIDKIFHELSLRVHLRHRSRVDVGASGLVTCDQSFVCHDLHQLEGGGVARFPGVGKSLMHLTHGGGPAFPKDPQNFELCVGGSRSYT